MEDIGLDVHKQYSVAKTDIASFEGIPGGFDRHGDGILVGSGD